MIATEKAVVVATNITEHLFADNWQLRTDGDFGKPGTADTPDSELPVVRLFPPEGKRMVPRTPVLPERWHDHQGARV
jgi:hypothetical protein